MKFQTLFFSEKNTINLVSAEFLYRAEKANEFQLHYDIQLEEKVHATCEQ